MLRTCPSKQYIHSRESKSQDLIPKLPPNLSTTVSDDLSLQCLTTTTLSLLPRYKHVFWCFMTTRGATIYIGLELESIMLMVQFKYQMHSGKLAFQGRMVHPPLSRGIWSFLSPTASITEHFWKWKTLQLGSQACRTLMCPAEDLAQDFCECALSRKGASTSRSGVGRTKDKDNPLKTLPLFFTMGNK